MEQQKFEDDAGELEITEDYVVLDDATTGGNLDLSNLRKRKIKIISSAKETIENGESSSYVIYSTPGCHEYVAKISYPCKNIVCT